jgi:AmmeMemoRadiSam system protein A
MEFTPEEQSFLLQVACWSVRRRLEGAPSPIPVVPFSAGVMRAAGCFVSLHRQRDHALRGCVGRIEIASPLLESLLSTAWGVSHDPRFVSQPVTLAELPELMMEVSVLGILKPTANPLAFEPRTDGIFLSAAGRTGVFLPQVARETGWTREQLLDRLAQEKLGLPANTWRQPFAKLFTFEATVIGPVPFIMDANPTPLTPQPKNAITTR